MLDEDYCPPCLDYKVADRLARFSTELNGLLQQRGEALAARLAQPEAAGTAEIADFLLLQTVNRARPLVAHFEAMTGCHPETLFQSAVQLAGDLDVQPARRGRAPVFPVYRHDRLKETFMPVIDALRAALARVADPTVVPIPLEERRYGAARRAGGRPFALHAARPSCSPCVRRCPPRRSCPRSARR